MWAASFLLLPCHGGLGHRLVLPGRQFPEQDSGSRQELAQNSAVLRRDGRSPQVKVAEERERLQALGDLADGVVGQIEDP
jgi:hypothetical protein